MLTAKQEAYFWERVDVRQADECWAWTRAINSTGYGTVVLHGKSYTAHRVAAWLVGLVNSPSAPAKSDERTFVLHRCDNRKCCNPHHFFLGSYAENQLDCYNKGRRPRLKGETHPNAKLTQSQVDEIRLQHMAGARQVDLAAVYGVGQKQISRIVRRQAYA